MNSDSISVTELINKKNKLNLAITNYYSEINDCKNQIKDLERQIFMNCNHKWIYDQCANFDDHIKYLCETCGLYKSHHLYKVPYSDKYYN